VGGVAVLNYLLHLLPQALASVILATKAFMPFALPIGLASAKQIYPVVKLVIAIHDSS
jgi:hypothetical protein